MIYKLLIFLCIFSLGSYSKELLIKEDISNSEQFFELIFKNINNEKINIKFENNIPNFLIKLGVNKDTEIILDSSENNLTDLDKFKEIPFINSFKDFYKNFIEKVIEMVNNLKIDIIDENITSDKKLFLINVIKYKYQIGLKKYAFDEIIKKLFYGKSGDFIYKNMLTNKNDQYYHQGYKIHVSATEASAFKILSLLYNELDNKNIYFKVVNGSKNLVKLNKDPIQKGKFITIYPKDDYNALNIATNLDKILKEHTTKDDFIRSPNDAQLGNSEGLSTRYGLFHQYNKDDQIKKIEKGEILNEFIKDDRTSGYKPDFIDWQPFKKLLSDNVSDAPKIYFQGVDRNPPETNNSTSRRRRR